MAITEKIKSFFRSETPAAQLGELRARIAAAQTRREELETHRPSVVVAKLQGDADAERELQTVDATIIALDAELRDLRQAANEVQSRMAQAEAKARQDEAEARPRRLAELRQLQLRLIDETQRDMETAAGALRAVRANVARLAEELDHDHAKRLFSAGAIGLRLQNAFARSFQIDPQGELRPGNNLLGIAGHEIGRRSWMTAAERETEVLDDLVPFFLTHEEAHEARRCLAARDGGDARPEAVEARARKIVVVALPSGVFTLVPVDRVFGDRASAEAAVRGQLLSVESHEDGFVLLPARFTGRAA